MHLVEVAVKPVEEAVHAIPLVGIRLIARLALHDELELFLVELGPGDIGADLVFLGGSLQVAKTLAVNLALKGTNGALVDRLAPFRNDQTVVDLDVVLQSVTRVLRACLSFVKRWWRGES